MGSAEEKSNPTDSLIARLWQRNTPRLLERLKTLDAAADAACNGTLSADLHARALAQAHNLAGSLGMFGYPQGTALAREIEELLGASTPQPPERLLHLTRALRSTLFPTA